MLFLNCKQNKLKSEVSKMVYRRDFQIKRNKLRRQRTLFSFVKGTIFFFVVFSANVKSEKEKSMKTKQNK